MENHTVPDFLQKPMKSKEEADDREEEHDHEDEQEDAISLCDLPLNNNECNQQYTHEPHPRSISSTSSSEVTDSFFEFFSSFRSEMRPAEDMIFCGKLIPFSDPLPSLSTNEKHAVKPDHQKIYHCRRSESLSKLQTPVTRSNSVSKSRPLMRNSRSLDDRRLHRSSRSKLSISPENIDRSLSSRSFGKSDAVQSKKVCKPRWYLFMFGLVKVPTEMELNDIKNRQLRRNPSISMIPATDSDGKVPVNRNIPGKVSWRILKALSCKDHSSVAVTMPFPYFPQACKN